MAKFASLQNSSFPLFFQIGITSSLLPNPSYKSMQTSSPKTPSNTPLNTPSMLRPLVTLIAILAAFATNVVSNLSPPNGETIANISNRDFQNVLIVPANYAFAIWGFIYLGLFTFGIYQLLPAQRHRVDLDRAGYLVAFASVVQIAWVYLFLARQFVLSAIAMLLILLPLIGAYKALCINVLPVNRGRRWLANIPIAVYLGWISVATIVNIACTLYSLGWNGFGFPQVWTVVILLIATYLGDLVQMRRRDIAFPGVILWALIAIAVRHVSAPVIFVAASACCIALILRIIGHRREATRT